MFATYNENILSSLEETYNSGNYAAFKKQFTNYSKVITSSPNIRRLYKIYEEVNKVRFDENGIAMEFINDVLTEIKGLNLKEVAVLKNMISDNVVKLKENTINYCLDKLIFEPKLTISERVLTKRSLSHILCDKTTAIEYVNKLSTLTETVSSNMLDMKEEEREVLELFIENDSTKIKEFYCDLIKETENIVENNILSADSSDVIQMLVRVKHKLNEIKTSSPTISEIDKVLSLKRSL